MNNYIFCGRSIASNIGLLELPSADNDGSFFFFYKENESPLFGTTWKHHWYVDTTLTLSYGVYEQYHWLRFPDPADFKISLDGREIHGYPFPGVPEHTLRHLLLDQVLPRCLAHQGHLLLHASSVQTSEGFDPFYRFLRRGEVDSRWFLPTIPVARPCRTTAYSSRRWRAMSLLPPVTAGYDFGRTRRSFCSRRLRKHVRWLTTLPSKGLFWRSREGRNSKKKT